MVTPATVTEYITVTDVIALCALPKNNALVVVVATVVLVVLLAVPTQATGSLHPA